MFTDDFKADIVDRAQVVFNRLPGPEDLPHRQCLRWALATMLALNEQGIRAGINAGSASFLAVPPELDDGVSPTHLSFFWQNEKHSVESVAALNHLPEIHVWTVIPDHNLIVDISSQWMHIVAAECGIKWFMPPPAIMWGELPGGWMYEPSVTACALAYQLAADILRIYNDETLRQTP